MSDFWTFVFAVIISSLIAAVVGLTIGWIDPWPNRQNRRYVLVVATMLLPGVIGTLWAWIATSGGLNLLSCWMVTTMASILAEGIAINNAPKLRQSLNWNPDDTPTR